MFLARVPALASLLLRGCPATGSVAVTPAPAPDVPASGAGAGVTATDPVAGHPRSNAPPPVARPHRPLYARARPVRRAGDGRSGERVDQAPPVGGGAARSALGAHLGNAGRPSQPGTPRCGRGGRSHRGRRGG